MLMAHCVAQHSTVSVDTRVRMNGRLLSGCAQLSHGLLNWAHINFSHFNALVVVDFQFLVDNAGRSLNGNAFLRTFS
jgi:hypothetical protein